MALRKMGISGIIAVAVAGILLTVTTLGLLSANQTIPFSRTIRAVKVGLKRARAKPRKKRQLTI